MFDERRRVRAPRQPDEAASRRGNVDHQDWLLDQALEETFPASDPISPMSAQSLA